MFLLLGDVLHIFYFIPSGVADEPYSLQLFSKEEVLEVEVDSLMDSKEDLAKTLNGYLRYKEVLEGYSVEDWNRKYANYIKLSWQKADALTLEQYRENCIEVVDMYILDTRTQMMERGYDLSEPINA